MIIKKYKSLCKNDYKEVVGYDTKTYLFKGREYDVHEEHWGEGSIMRKVIIPNTKCLNDDGVEEKENAYVGFLTIPFFNYFYSTDELRDLKLKEIGIHE